MEASHMPPQSRAKSHQKYLKIRVLQIFNDGEFVLELFFPGLKDRKFCSGGIDPFQSKTAVIEHLGKGI